MATRQNIAPPNLVIAPKEYEQRYQEQLNNVHRLFYSSVANAINSPIVHGQFYTSGADLLNASTTAVNLVPFSVTSAAFNTKIGAQNTRLYVAETGVYNVQFSAQCDLSSGSNGIIYFWLKQNGSDIADTSGKVIVSGPNAATMAAWNYLLLLKAGDYIELAWSSTDIHSILKQEAAHTTAPIRPALPAVILTITWVSSYNTSVGIS